VVGAELAPGALIVTDGPPDRAAARRPRVADGSIGDWVGRRTGFGGATTYSRGEYVYEDHIWDASGASSDASAGTGTLLDALAQSDPDAYRGQAANLYATATTYGAGPVDYAGDLLEVRVATTASHVSLLVRTTVMTKDLRPAILVLADTTPGDVQRTVPFGSGLTTHTGDVALLLAGDRGTAVDLATGARRSFTTVTNPDGYTNAVEASVPRDLIARGGHVKIAVAAGRLDPATGELAPRATGPAIANAAFRREPARPEFDKLQAAALHDRTIDPFFADVDLAKLEAGVTQHVTAGPGYHDRITVSNPSYSREAEKDGIFQHYGAYLPAGYLPGHASAATWFLHGSGNDAHDLPTVLPGLTHALGDARGSIVLAPKGRSSLSLWEGAGLADVLEVEADARRTFAIDRSRVSMAGYSMGGLGAFLLPALFPDRYSSSFAIEGPVGGDVWSPGVLLNGLPDTRRIFANLRTVPMAMYQGGSDNNVPFTNGKAAADTLAALGYRYRLFIFPGDNHFTPGVVDRWDDAIGYLSAFPRIDRAPPRVTYVRDMRFEQDVNKAVFSDQKVFPPGGHRFRFDRAFWMSELTPAKPADEAATVDARSLAIVAPAVTVVPEQGAGASPDPFTYTGQGWAAAGPPAATRNAFIAALSGAAAVRFDLRRMRIDTRRRIVASIAADAPLKLRLSGRWRSRPLVRVDGRRMRVARTRKGIAIRLAAGRHRLAIIPAPAR
jgi:predicted esterase